MTRELTLEMCKRFIKDSTKYTLETNLQYFFEPNSLQEITCNIEIMKNQDDPSDGGMVGRRLLPKKSVGSYFNFKKA